MNVPLESLPLFLEWIRKSCFSPSLSAVAELHCSSAGVRVPPPTSRERLLQFPGCCLCFFFAFGSWSLELCRWEGGVPVNSRGGRRVVLLAGWLARLRPKGYSPGKGLLFAIGSLHDTGYSRTRREGAGS